MSNDRSLKYITTSTTAEKHQLLQGVLSATDELVADALQGHWSKVLDGVEQRRRVMQHLVNGNITDTRVAALEAAVTESEQAIMRVVAHAIASSRWSGALYGLHT